ncbi:MAG: S8 family serine peptidase, partial [Candidatus Zixiibacteriota bacterium]
MKRLTFVLFLAALMLATSALANKVISVEPQEGPSFFGYAPDKCIVIFKEGAPTLAGNRDLADIVEKFQIGRFARQFPGAKDAHPVDRKLTRYYKAHFPEGNLEKVLEAYRRLPFVEKAEPIGIYRLTATPNDYYYDDSTTSFPLFQWHYWETYGITADLAWDKETGDASVIVAVADAGVRYYHYDIGGTDPPGPNDPVTNGNVWVNDGEIPGNGIDDDNNGYIDDVIGWDFVASGSFCNDADCTTPDNDPRDGNGHGTHVAGTIAAITNNDPNWGVAGVAGGWNDGTTNYTANGVKIMCLRIGWNSPFGGLVGMDYAAEAFYYVATMVDKGYNVTAINCSWGSNSLVAAATDAVLARDVMVIAAAGNDNSSSCDYLGCRSDVLDVGGTERSGNPYSGSNYGSWVDIAAPAVNIVSTYHQPSDPDYDYIAALTGTSMACPHVVSVAALLESFNPSLTGPEKFAIITDVNNTKPYNQTKYVGVGIVDARKCLDAAGTCDLNADFTADLPTGCAPLTVGFTDLSTGTGIDGWDWDFGDGIGTSTAQNPTYVYNNPGTYTVTLTVSSSSQGCNDTEIKVDFVTVNDVPVADFSGSPTTGTAPLTVDFTDLSSGNPDSWDWDFGDGLGSSTLQNPSYTYNDPGDYTVTLVAYNLCGSDTDVKTDYIHVDSAGVFTKAYAQSDIPIYGTVSGDFTNTFASDNVYETITEIEYTGHPRKRYSYLEHKWMLNVGSGGTSMTFYLEAYRPGNADGDDFVFAYSIDDVTYNSMVTVASATEQVYSSAMPAGLTGTVYIRVLDTDRNWDNVSLDPVYIDEMYIEYSSEPGPPIAEFIGNPTSGTAPLTVDFTDLSIGEPTSWSWTFGDGNTSSLQNPQNTYQNAGT